MKTTKNGLLSRKVKGFSGITHLLIAIFLFLIIISIPMDFFKNYISIIKSDWKFVVTAFIIICGAALLPDLDNDESTAGYQLGIIGKLLKTIMKTSAFVLYSLYNLRNDKRPKSMHRMFWHTPFAAFTFIVIFWFFIPANNEVLWDNIINSWKSGNLTMFVVHNITVSFCIFLIFVATLLGSNILLYWPFKFLPFSHSIKTLINFVLPLLVLFYSLNLTYFELRYLGISVGLGYLFHIIGDAFSQGSAPLIWPIPWKGQAWYKPNILGPFMVQTGGLINMILNFTFLAFNIILVIRIF